VRGAPFEKTLKPEDLDHAVDFGLQIRFARRVKKISAQHLAELIGVTLPAIYQWERGLQPHRRTTGRVIPLLARYLDLDESALWWTWRTTQVPHQNRKRRAAERKTTAMALKAQRAQERQAAYEERRQRWANDYREHARLRDGRATERLAQVWGISPKAVGTRVAVLFSLDYLDPSERYSGREVCSKGHPMTGGNIIEKKGMRRCRACFNRRKREYEARRRRRQNPDRIQHGTKAAYRLDHCRCEVCLAWRQADRKRLRTNRSPRPVGKQITAFGETKNISAWARDPHCVVTPGAFCQRLRAGWDLEEALVTPKGGNKSNIGKLTPEDVRAIRRVRAETGMSFKKLGQMFKVSEATAYFTVYRKIWSEIDPDEPTPVAQPYPSDDEVLDVYFSADDAPVRAVAQKLGITYHTAQRRISRMRKRGLIPPYSKK
jgi:transcriptional regulator with XRE-family HTH domain